MNKLIKLSIATSMIALSLGASDLNDVNKKIKNLQTQIKELKEQQLDSSDELEERIDEVETATMTDKIQFGLEFRTRMDSFQSTRADGIEYNNNNIWSNRLRLNMSSKITDDMKFTGRLAMYKNWSDNGSTYSYSHEDSMQGRRPSDSSIYVARAYVDWKVFKGSLPVTLTIGRQPSSDGPSYQFKENTVRKSTYSALSFDGTTDGVVATFNLQKLSHVDGMAFRIAYGKGYQASTGLSYTGEENAINDADVFGAFFESGFGIEGSLMQLGAVEVNNVISNIPSDNKTIGDMHLYTAMVELKDIGKSGVDLFVHYGVSQGEPNGKTSNYNGQQVGFLTSIDGDTATKDGSAFWTGGRYTLPFESMKNPKIGVEYNHGSKNWFSFTQGSNDVTNKLATRGDATEIYYTQPINRYAYLRFGAIFIDYEYTGSAYQIGTPIKVSQVASVNPQQLDKINNFYLLFNVKY